MDEKQLFKGIACSALISEAMSALGNCYAPYSGFHVAAALLAESGKIYTGVNVENASYSAGICAERNAAAHAAACGERRFTAIAIVAGAGGRITGYCPPCGICRQVLREFCDPAELAVITAVSPEDYRVQTLADLLPDSFGPEYL